MKEEETNKLFPLFLKLNELRLLIVGGGNVACEKLKAVLENSPETNITLVAKEIKEELNTQFGKIPNVKILKEEYNSHHILLADIIIVAVNDLILAEKILKDAHAKGKLVNVADKPSLCDFYLGSVVQKGNLKIAISTNGKSPTMAKRVKETLDEAFPEEIDEVLDNLYQIRNNLSGDFKDKVKKMNAITSTMAKSSQSNLSQRIKKTFVYSLSVLVLMFLGHVILTYVPIGNMKVFFSDIGTSLGPEFLLYLLGGAIAQLIDGALGMAYGVSVTTFLISLGIPGITPAVASASMHASEIFTTGTASLVYMRHKNV
ncbi:MAG: siroheme synthase, partial [Bacteroidia bacterium]|nr:siroheme synthase [Bacteroidia bacterium]